MATKRTAKTPVKRKTSTKTRAPKPSVAATLAAEHELPEKGALGKVKARVRKLREGAPPPSVSDLALAREQLRVYVREYDDNTRQAKRTRQRTCDRVNRETGAVTKCTLDALTVQELHETADAYDAIAGKYKTKLQKALRLFPLYRVFLAKVPAFGKVNVAARLLASVNIQRCEKVSSLQQMCGLGLRRDADGKGHAQRPVAGVKLDYHADLKQALWQAFDALRRNSTPKTYKTGKLAGRTVEAPEAVRNSPYLKRAIDYKHRLQTDARRYDEASNLFDGRKGGRAIIDRMCWRPAAQLFLEHYYLVARALEGLPVWPSYEAARLGFEHGGKVCVDAARRITVEEALALAGVPDEEALELPEAAE